SRQGAPHRADRRCERGGGGEERISRRRPNVAHRVGFVLSPRRRECALFRAPSAPMKFESLQRDLQAARAGTLDMGTLARRLRGLILPPALPPKFGEVLAEITDRIESSA